MAIDKLTIPKEHWRSMVAHVARQSPEEACGLLGGPPGRVERTYLVENVRHSPVDYLMAPEAQVRAMLDLEAQGWDVNGIFHSHPAGPPVPSATDIELAYYPEAVYIILAPEPDGAWQGRGFTIEDGQVREVVLALAE